MEQAPTLGPEATNEDVARARFEEEERMREEAIALAEKTFADFYRENPEAAEEAWERVKRNTELQ